MQPFDYRGGELYCENVPVAAIARKIGTPFYLYSQSALAQQFRAFDDAFASLPHLTCYAVKANSNLAILSLFRILGAGFDVVSKGELMRAIAAGADPKKIVFSGVGKTENEIDLGLRRGILQFNVESAAEFGMLEARARALGKVCNIALRVNPDVDAGTHPYIATGSRRHKFGISAGDTLEICRRARRSRHVRVTGIACHIGSQITSMEPFLKALRQLREIFLNLRAQGVDVRHMDLGGGLGIEYNDEKPPCPGEYARAVLSALRGVDCTLILEPGRVIVGNAGILVTSVVLTKRTGEKNFIVVDAGMSDLLRPSLYGSYHGIQAVARHRRGRCKADVVGPICESGDFLARDREMPIVKAKELLAIMSAGAYGFVLSSNYNTRARPAEVLVRGRRVKTIRKRERFEDLIRGESARPM
ncbi:MAG: diaminopimelate decarboxylase [Acidobacteriia bacterium]|nr:diaminopimelate decarboxylase [Terriglobia bacterium]